MNTLSIAGCRDGRVAGQIIIFVSNYYLPKTFIEHHTEHPVLR